MDSQVQSYQGASRSRPPLDFLQCIADNVSDDLPSYTGLAPPPPNYETFERETEAKTILRGQDFQSITQILRFRLYGHKDSLRQVLQHRWDCQLGRILIGLHPTRFKDDHQAVAKLSKAQKIEVILGLVEPTQSPSPVYWSWNPYEAANETDAGKIAADIDEESCSLFRKVPFRDWLRHAVGYQELSVDQLVFQHENLSRCLSEYLCRHPEENHKYLEVKKILRNRSPLAHQALSHCLQSTPRPMTRSHVPFDLKFLIGQLRYLFQSRNLLAILSILPILEIRFDHTYNSVLDDINWRGSFRIEVDSFDTLIAGTSAKQFASDATISDKRDMDLLCPTGFKYQDAHRIYLEQKSNAITIEAAEYCIAHPPLMHYFREVVEELLHLRNWYRFSAILLALRRACFDESILPTYFNLINPDQHYAAFRAQMKAQPGVPFLFPYVQQYTLHGEAVLAEVFSFASYNMEAVLAQSAHPPEGLGSYVIPWLVSAGD